MIVASILRMERDTRLAQQVQPLVDHTQIQIAVGLVAFAGSEV